MCIRDRDYKVQPGDVVSVYATAKDARKTASTDMFFIEMQPFERNYTPVSYTHLDVYKRQPECRRQA